MPDTMATAMSPYAQRYARVAGGGTRTTNLNPGQQPMTAAAPMTPATPFAPPAGPAPGGSPLGANYDPNSLGSNIGAFQNAAGVGVQGYGDMVGQDFQKQVGGMLGDLNSIGGLRSGATVTSMNDLTTNYGRQIGNYAKMAEGDATKMGQEEYDANVERKYRADSEKRARKNSIIGAIGGIVGGAAGAYFGGPQGAMAGSSVGSKI